MARPIRSTLSAAALPSLDAAMLRAGDEAGIARLQSRGHGVPDAGRTQGPPGPQAVGNANNDAFTGVETTILTGSVFADNGSGPDVTPVAVAAVNGSAMAVNNQITLASGAKLTLNDNGNFTYDPTTMTASAPAPDSGAANTTVTDTFTYTLVNGDTATVTITVSGVDSNDLLVGSVAGATLRGGIGNDLYAISANNVTVIENVGEGFDSLYVNRSYTLAAGSEVEWLQITSQSGSLTGNEFAQYLIGSAGNNMLNGGGGADTMIGGAGNDQYIVDNAGDLTYERDNEGSDSVATTVSYTLLAGQSIEALLINAINSTTPLTLVGNEFSNSISGNNGDNVLDGGGGVDFMSGRLGNDTYIVDNASDGVNETEGGFDAIYTSVSYAIGASTSVEWISAIDNAATTAINLRGSDIANYLIGNNGDNVLDGAAGADIMIGYGGNDTYVVDNAGDVASESAGAGFDALYTSVSYALAAGSEIEWLSTSNTAGTATINLTGNEFANFLLGNNGDNLLIGGGGADNMQGYGGNDTYFVDNVADLVSETAGNGNDEVKTSVSYTLAAGQSVETLSTAASFGTDAINLTGNELANALIGNDGANTLNGGAGSDTLTGRAGADIFQFTTALGAGNVDTIADMLSGTDKIALDDAIFTAIGAPGALAAGAFVTGTAAGDADDRIIYNSATGALFYDADGNGAGAAVQFATLTGNPVLAASDFQVI